MENKSQNWEWKEGPTTTDFHVSFNGKGTHHEFMVQHEGKPVAFKKEGVWTILDAEKALESLASVIKENHEKAIAKS